MQDLHRPVRCILCVCVRAMPPCCWLMLWVDTLCAGCGWMLDAGCLLCGDGYFLLSGGGFHFKLRWVLVSSDKTKMQFAPGSIAGCQHRWQDVYTTQEYLNMMTYLFSPIARQRCATTMHLDFPSISTQCKPSARCIAICQHRWHEAFRSRTSSCRQRHPPCVVIRLRRHLLASATYRVWSRHAKSAWGWRR